MLTIYSSSERSGGVSRSALRFGLCLYYPQSWQSTHLSTVMLRPNYHTLAVTQAVQYPGELLDYYLSLPQLKGAQMRIGLNLQVDDQSWTNHVSGQFWHLSQWFTAIAHVLLKPEQEEVHAFVWEQSHLALHRRRNALVLQDIEVTDGFAWAPIMVSLKEFTQQLLRVAQQFRNLIVLLNQEMALRGGLYPKTNADLHCRYRGARSSTAAAIRRFRLLWRELNDFPDTMTQLQRVVTHHNPSWL